MIRLFAFFSCAALAGSLMWTAEPLSAQTKPFTAPVRGLANPFGSTSAIAGQSRPLGGIPAPSYGSGRRVGHYGRGYGAGVYGFSTYIPGYWDLLGDPAGGPYSYTSPAYGAIAPPPPPAAPAPGPPAGGPPPPVIINQYFGYPPPPGGEQGQAQPGGAAQPGDPLAEPQSYYLIVYKD